MSKVSRWHGATIKLQTNKHMQKEAPRVFPNIKSGIWHIRTRRDQRDKFILGYDSRKSSFFVRCRAFLQQAHVCLLSPTSLVSIYTARLPFYESLQFQPFRKALIQLLMRFILAHFNSWFVWVSQCHVTSCIQSLL